MLTFSRRLGCTARHLSAQSDTCRRLGCVAKHLRCAAKRAVVSAAGDGDGGSGGNPRDALVITERGGIEYLNPMGSTAEKSATPFSRVTRAGGMVYVSGTGTGSDADGKPRVGTATEETRWALENLKQILEDAGSSLERVVQVFCLVQDKKDYAEINAEYVKHWILLPARSTTHGFAGGTGKVGFGCIALVNEE